MSSEKVCFIISPIGESDSPIRKLADEKFDLIFEPVLNELGYTPIRADKENTPNSISRTIVRRLIDSELVIADVTGYNANVFYELAIRNAAKKPVIIVKEVDQKLPFDVYDKRAISIDMTNNRQWITAKAELKQYILNALKDPKSASESILSEYAFDLASGKTPDAQQEMVLIVKDLKDEITTLRSEVKQQNRGSSFSTEDSESYNFRIRNDRLTKNDKLSVHWRTRTFNTGDKIKTEIFDPNGNKVATRETQGSPNLVGSSFSVSEFAKESGVYAITIWKNGDTIFGGIFTVV